MAFRSSMTENVIHMLLQPGLLEVSRPDGDGSGESAATTDTTDAATAMRSRLSAEHSPADCLTGASGE